MQRTVPTAVKFLGPLLVLLISLVRLCGGLKSSSTLSGTTSVATSSDVLTIKEAMQAHESQYVWCVALFICSMPGCACSVFPQQAEVEAMRW